MTIETKKNRIQQKIHCYETRQRVTGKSSSAMAKSLYSWRRSLKLIEKKQKEVEEIGNLVKDYSGLSVCSVTLLKTHNKNKKRLRVLELYYKIGLERGLQQSYLNWYTGYKSCASAYRLRNSFNKKIQTIPEYTRFWNNFKLYLNEKE